MVLCSGHKDMNEKKYYRSPEFSREVTEYISLSDIYEYNNPCLLILDYYLLTDQFTKYFNFLKLSESLEKKLRMFLLRKREIHPAF
jgi:hypothetical protein